MQPVPILQRLPATAGVSETLAKGVLHPLPGMGNYLLGSGRSQGHPCKGVSCGVRGERDPGKGVAARAARCSGRALRRRRGRSGLPASSRPENLPLLQLRVISTRKAITRLLNRQKVLFSPCQPRDQELSHKASAVLLHRRHLDYSCGLACI